MVGAWKHILRPMSAITQAEACTEGLRGTPGLIYLMDTAPPMTTSSTKVKLFQGLGSVKDRGMTMDQRTASQLLEAVASCTGACAPSCCTLKTAPKEGTVGAQLHSTHPGKSWCDGKAAQMEPSRGTAEQHVQLSALFWQPAHVQPPRFAQAKEATLQSPCQGAESLTQTAHQVAALP